MGTCVQPYGLIRRPRCLTLDTRSLISVPEQKDMSVHKGIHEIPTRPPTQDWADAQATYLLTCNIYIYIYIGLGVREHTTYRLCMVLFPVSGICNTFMARSLRSRCCASRSRQISVISSAHLLTPGFYMAVHAYRCAYFTCSVRLHIRSFYKQHCTGQATSSFLHRARISD